MSLPVVRSQTTTKRVPRRRRLCIALLLFTGLYLVLAARLASLALPQSQDERKQSRTTVKEVLFPPRQQQNLESPYKIELVPLDAWSQLLREMKDPSQVFEEHDQIFDASQGVRWGVARQHHFLIELGRIRNLGLNLTLRDMYIYSRDQARIASSTYYRYKEEALRRCAWNKESVRWFATSNRHDFTGFAAEELQELGLCNSSDPRSTGLDFYIGEQFETNTAPSKQWAYHYSRYLRNDSIIGALPGAVDFFGTKLSFAGLFDACDQYTLTKNALAHLCDNGLLYTFNVNAPAVDPETKVSKNQVYLESNQVPGIDRIFRSLKHMRTPIWFIVKPQIDTFLSRGMHISRLSSEYLRSQSSLLQWLGASVTAPRCTEHGGYVPALCNRRRMSFQRYIHTPALFGGRKFDVRIWLVITSLDPLRIFIMRHGYPKIAAMPFSTDPDHLNTQCMHIKMLVPDDSCPVQKEEYLHSFARHGYPKSTASFVFFDSLRFPGLSLFAHEHDGLTDAGMTATAERRRLATLAEHVWSAKTWPGIESSLTKTLLLVRSRLVLRDDFFRNESIRQQQREQHNKTFASPTYNRWILLSPDIVIDDQGRPSIIEINTNGHIMGTHSAEGGFIHLFHDQGYLRAMLQLLGADGYPRRHLYADALSQAIDQFCKEPSRHCSSEARIAMAKAVDEEAHTGPHWYRLYPPINCRPPRDAPSACVRDELGSWWPHQLRLTKEQSSAFDHSPLDMLVTEFLHTVDTAKIHGIPQVPGPGRWQPRKRFYDEADSRPTKKKRNKQTRAHKQEETEEEQDEHYSPPTSERRPPQKKSSKKNKAQKMRERINRRRKTMIQRKQRASLL